MKGTTMNYQTMTLDEIKAAGHLRGLQCAEHQTRPDVGSRVSAMDGMCRSGSIVLEDEDEVDEYVTACAYGSEENSRSFSPFEFTAHGFNERDDAEDAWEAFDAGIAAGIAEGVRTSRAGVAK
jgi:hypothetical protein